LPVEDLAKASPAPGTKVTPGQLPLETLIGPEGLAAQEAQATRPTVRADALERAGDIRRTMSHMPTLERINDTMGGPGNFAERWYTGAYPELVKQFGSNDSVIMAKMIAATSPRSDPLWNLENALRAYTKWNEAGRPPMYAFDKGFLPAYQNNLMRAINMRRDPATGIWQASKDFIPVESQKVSNYLLDILGSEQHPTIDRWMVNILFRKPSTAADLTTVEYQTAADRLREIAPAFNTTPVRLQAALWTGQKILADERIMGLLQKGLSREQAVPALRDVIRYKANEYRAKGLLPAASLTPGVVLGLFLAEQHLDPHSVFQKVREADVQREGQGM
jgi:hypothetical protein